MKVTAIKQQEKRKDRYSIFVDGTYAFSLSESALLESKLASGQGLSIDALQQYKQLSADDKLYGNALRYAAMRLRSEWELHEYLRRKQASSEAVEMIVQRLRRAGLLDDKAFARAWIENRRLLKPSSVRKLQQELKAKRISDDIIRAVLQASEPAAAEQVALHEVIVRKRRQGKYRDDPVKLMQYLVRQGFSYDDVKSAVQSASGQADDDAGA